MAKVRNYHFYGTPEKVNRLKEEYEFIGRITRLEGPNHLVVLALPPKKEKKKIDPRREDRKSGEGRTRAPRGDRD